MSSGTDSQMKHSVNLTLLFALVFAALTAPPVFARTKACGNKPASKTAGQQNLEAVDKLIAASSAEDVDTVLSIFSEDAVLSQPFLPSGPASYAGRSEIGAAYLRIFNTFDAIRYGDRRFTVSADEQTIFAEMQGDFDLSGGAGEYDNYFVFRVDFDTKGCIASLTQYQNSHYTASVFGAFRAREAKER